MRLACSRAALDAEEARWLVEAMRVRVYEPLGFGTLLEYLERVLGYGPRLARERLRVAEALSQLPALHTALVKGDLPWSAVRELSRVATPTTEAEWVVASDSKTVRQIEEMVSGRRSGDRPGDPPDPKLRRHVLRLEISADALAAFREARRHLELEVGHPLEDDEMVRMLAHCALDGSPDPGRAAYQVAMTVCTECRRGTRDGAGQVFDLESQQVDAALCDAQQVYIDCRTAEDETDPSLEPDVGPSESTSEPSPRSDHLDAAGPGEQGLPLTRHATTGESGSWSGDGQVAPALPTHVGRPGPDASPISSCDGHGGPRTAPALAQAAPVLARTAPMLARTAPVLAPRPVQPPLVPAATQTIPPRIRRLVWRRDHRRCQVPGCRAARYLEIHHLVPLSEGGDHDPSRMLLICWAHHTRIHAGRLRIEGLAPDRLVFTHANGAPYGDLRCMMAGAAIERGSPRADEARGGMEADAIDALRRTGVSLGDARRAVAEAVRSRPAAIEELIRQAFVILGRTAYATRVSERRGVYSHRGTSWGAGRAVRDETSAWRSARSRQAWMSCPESRKAVDRH
jgi:hypothetical protein